MNVLFSHLLRNVSPFFAAASLLFAPLSAVWEPAVFVNDLQLGATFLSGPVLSVSKSGNGVAAWTSGSSVEVNGVSFPTPIMSAFYTRGIGWSLPEVISSLEIVDHGGGLIGPRFSFQGDAAIAMNDSNYAVAVWEGFAWDVPPVDDRDVIVAAVRDGSGWQPVEIISQFGEAFITRNPRVALNEAGTAVVAWREINQTVNPAEDYTKVSMLPLGGSWSSPLTISNPEVSFGDGDNKPDVAIDSSGNIAVVWMQRLDVNEFGVGAATYNAGTATWSSPVSLTTTNLDVSRNPRVAMDDQGNAIAVWIETKNNSSFEVRAAYFQPGSGWSAAETIGLGSATGVDPMVVMDPQGNATATWENGGQVYAATKLYGQPWSPPVIISVGSLNTYSSFFQDPLAVDGEGNVIAIWTAIDGESTPFVYVASKLFGKPWQTPEVIYSDPYNFGYPSVGLGNCGFAVTLWQSSIPFNGVMSAVNGNILVPQNVRGKHCCEQFAAQKRWLDVLKWDLCFPGCIESYRIRCRGEIIGIVESPNRYFINAFGCKKTACGKCDYTISSVNVWGFESEQVPVLFQSGSCCK